jgi:CRP/FNR family nitrogen fixation transcriptional regulator
MDNHSSGSARYSPLFAIPSLPKRGDQPADLNSVRLAECRLLPEDNHQSAKRAVLALRRGPIRYKRNEMLFCEGDSAEYAYLVISGVIRCCRTLEAGQRQISAFYVPGDLFGLGIGPEHTVSGEAVTDTTLVMSLKRSALLLLASRDSGIASLLLASNTYELKRLQEHSFFLTRSAKCRLAGFLLDLAARMASANDVVELPMSRQEIADYLGLTIETVSRTFTQFEHTGMIARKGSRHIVIGDRRALQQITS